MLLTRQLFFTRSDKFDDPFEGIFRLKDHEQTSVLFETQPQTKKYYFLNCWHINEFQSDAMWKIFLYLLVIKNSLNYNLIVRIGSKLFDSWLSA